MRISLPESRKMHTWEFNFSKFSGGACPMPLDPPTCSGLWPATNSILAYFIPDAPLLE